LRQIPDKSQKWWLCGQWLLALVVVVPVLKQNGIISKILKNTRVKTALDILSEAKKI
jgi:hypothetical protein